MDKSPAIDEWTASFALTEWMASLLFGVSAGRPPHIHRCDLALVGVGCVLRPARRAANVDVVGVGLPLVTTRVRVFFKILKGASVGLVCYAIG